MEQTPNEQPVSTWTAMGRGLLRRCPNCGRARLFRSYLKPVERCSACGEEYGHIRADDGPPWLSLVIVGHLIIPMAYAAERMVVWPIWISVTLWSTVALLMSMATLPICKGLFVAIVWAKKTPGSERT
jgi:uncharacterized protein (DUF983 family)